MFGADRRKLISVHFPKAAGCSLALQLSHAFADKFYCDTWNTALGEDAHSIAIELPPGISVMHGHFRPHRYDLIENAVRFTFLRHPVNNIISIYYFWKGLKIEVDPLHSRFLAENPSITDFCKYPKIQRLMSDTFFGGYDMSRFDFIGFHETRIQDMPRLAGLIGVPLSPDVRENVTGQFLDERRDLENNPKVISELHNLLRDDIRFYEGQRNARQRNAA